MNNNLYHPPESRLSNGDLEPGSPIKAIIVGVAIDIFGTLLLSVILGIVFGLYWHYSGENIDALADHASQLDLTSPFQMVSMILGSLISLYAGYTCARIARQNIYFYAAVAGLIVSILSYLLGMQSFSQAESLFLSILSLAIYIYGAHLYKKRVYSISIT